MWMKINAKFIFHFHYVPCHTNILQFIPSSLCVCILYFVFLFQLADWQQTAHFSLFFGKRNCIAAVDAIHKIQRIQTKCQWVVWFAEIAQCVYNECEKWNEINNSKMTWMQIFEMQSALLFNSTFAFHFNIEWMQILLRCCFECFLLLWNKGELDKGQNRRCSMSLFREWRYAWKFTIYLEQTKYICYEVAFIQKKNNSLAEIWMNDDSAESLLSPCNRLFKQHLFIERMFSIA